MKKKFDVEITETLQRTVSVEADSREEAENMVIEAWNDEVYVLDSKDFVGVDFKTTEEQKISINAKLKDLQDAMKSSEDKTVSKSTVSHDR